MMRKLLSLYRGSIPLRMLVQMIVLGVLILAILDLIFGEERHSPALMLAVALSLMIACTYLLLHGNVFHPLGAIRSTLQKRAAGDHGAYAAVAREDEIGLVA